MELVALRGEARAALALRTRRQPSAADGKVLEAQALHQPGIVEVAAVEDQRLA